MVVYSGELSHASCFWFVQAKLTGCSLVTTSWLEDQQANNTFSFPACTFNNKWQINIAPFES